METKAKTAIEAEEIKKVESTESAASVVDNTEATETAEAPAETVETTVETSASAVDLTKVAGFKAVDSDGNELGIVTMQELQDSIASQVLNVVSQRMQASTLEEPAMLAANASTRAASDAFENQLTEQADFQWVRTLASDGSSTRVSKDNLATVVGERLNTSRIELILSKKSTGGGDNILAGVYTGIVFAFDQDDFSKYIIYGFFKDYQNSGDDKGPARVTVIASNGLSLGPSNNVGTQVISGGTNVVQYMIGFRD